MTLVKHHPAAHFTNLFDEFFGNHPVNWGRDVQTAFSTPKVNIHETADAYHVELNAPGRNKEDFKIDVENGLLTISYEKKTETENKEYKTIRKEFSYQSFKRSFNLDENINADAIQAKYENGVLKLLLPKKEEVKTAPKQITIS
ncbi:Hsp20/alpha crystallin family protein [Asinibacterium sp. OR53]|jgi:HSP20 family protein|uniref:Hsp20/alpha crystallin family protein n=1 Tax=Asinibacterium sp. OR53 TaxID=925409 RepID=UPI00047A1239|nr:Hsp20/alpha crystallin family protein [Asinibacterium sp. OR53]